MMQACTSVWKPEVSLWCLLVLHSHCIHHSLFRTRAMILRGSARQFVHIKLFSVNKTAPANTAEEWFDECDWHKHFGVNPSIRSSFCRVAGGSRLSPLTLGPAQTVSPSQGYVGENWRTETKILFFLLFDVHWNDFCWSSWNWAVTSSVWPIIHRKTKKTQQEQIK